MRKIGFLIAVAILGMSVPLTAPARAEETKKVIIKTADRDGDRDHDRRWHRDRDHRKVVIIKKHRGDRGRDHD